MNLFPFLLKITNNASILYMGHIDFAESISITQKCHICITDLEQNYTVFGYLNLHNLAVHSQYSKLFVCGKLLCIVFKMVWLDIN